MGTPAQKERYLARILSADEIWCQGFSEPDAGSDLAAARTRIEDKGDHFLVNGQKVWSSFAHIADFCILLGLGLPDEPRYRNLTYVIADMHAPGVEVRPLKQISGGAEFNEVFFSNVRVPRENLVGELNAGWQIAQTTLSYERGGNTLGRVSRQLAQFHRLLEVASLLRLDGTRAIDDPIIRQKLGQMYTEIEVLRYSSLRLLSRLEKGNRPGPESSATKLSYSEFEKRFMELAEEILGPYGQLTDGVPPEYRLEVDTAIGDHGTWAYAFLWSRAGTIYAGSSEIQKNVIGERILGLPKEARADRVGGHR